MKLDNQKPSESLLKMKAALRKDTEANTDEWKELVEELIPLNRREEWRKWCHENIETLSEKGFETQIEILIYYFLSSINNNPDNSQLAQNDDEKPRNYGQAEIRDGQNAFSLAVRENCDNKCVVTGCRVGSRLQAAHISPHKEDINYSVTNGLLLRADIHQMLDKGDCAIHPTEMKIYFKQSVMDIDPDLQCFNKNLISGFKIDIDWSGFEERWNKYNER